MPPPPPTKIVMKLQATYDYQPQQADELTLYEGEMVVVLERDMDGWTMVKNETGAEGLVPTSYLGTQQY